MEVGFYIGHNFKISKLYSRWFLLHTSEEFFFIDKWYELKKEIFIINLKLTLISIRMLVQLGYMVGACAKRNWFVCHNRYFGPLVARYAISIGSGYNVFD